MATQIHPGSSRLPSLTGMRFIAALLVFFCHATIQGFYQDMHLSMSLFRIGAGSGWLGVSFFFVLSGFVLTWSARAGDSPRHFWRRRIAKVGPNHLVVWALALLLVLVPGQPAGEGATVAKTVPSLFLVHAWIPDVEVIDALHVPSWSLSCELLFYLSFPWLLRWVSAIPAKRLWACAGGVVGAIVCVPLLSRVLLPDTPRTPFLPMSVWDYWGVYTLPPVRMLEFLLGILMARIVMSDRWIGLGLAPAVAVLLGGCFLQWHLTPSPYAMVAPTVVGLALVIPAAAVADCRASGSPFRGRLMVWLGEISFAMYLVHFLVLYFGHLAFGFDRTWSTGTAVAIQLLLLGVTLALSAAIHGFVERPAMRRWSRSRKPAAVSSTARDDAAAADLASPALPTGDVP
ncbi:acyltransferase family protein [Streptomyces sp. NPDC001668]|uniref:acyltransferase family protein n=1 Tax=unclassified Streptomyces TaxID=2593676 RepID=UPI003687C804